MRSKEGPPSSAATLAATDVQKTSTSRSCSRCRLMTSARIWNRSMPPFARPAQLNLCLIARTAILMPTAIRSTCDTSDRCLPAAAPRWISRSASSWASPGTSPCTPRLRGVLGSAGWPSHPGVLACGNCDRKSPGSRRSGQQRTAQPLRPLASRHLPRRRSLRTRARDDCQARVPGAESGEAISKKEARLKALWSARLSNQMSVLPPFDPVFREILNDDLIVFRHPFI